MIGPADIPSTVFISVDGEEAKGKPEKALHIVESWKLTNLQHLAGGSNRGL